jgi:hypothetical protein
MVAQVEMWLALDRTVVIVLAEGSQEEDTDEDRACDEQDYMEEGDILGNKDAGNAVQGTYSAGGKDKAHADMTPVVGHAAVMEVEVDRHEEANARNHELSAGAMNEHMQMVENGHEPVVVSPAQAWWESTFRAPHCSCEIVAWRQPPCSHAERIDEAKLSRAWVVLL